MTAKANSTKRTGLLNPIGVQMILSRAPDDRFGVWYFFCWVSVLSWFVLSLLVFFPLCNENGYSGQLFAISIFYLLFYNSYSYEIAFNLRAVFEFWASEIGRLSEIA